MLRRAGQPPVGGSARRVVHCAVHSGDGTRAERRGTTSSSIQSARTLPDRSWSRRRWTVAAAGGGRRRVSSLRRLVAPRRCVIARRGTPRESATARTAAWFACPLWAGWVTWTRRAPSWVPATDWVAEWGRTRISTCSTTSRSGPEGLRSGSVTAGAPSSGPRDGRDRRHSSLGTAMCREEERKTGCVGSERVAGVAGGQPTKAARARFALFGVQEAAVDPELATRRVHDDGKSGAVVASSRKGDDADECVVHFEGAGHPRPGGRLVVEPGEEAAYRLAGDRARGWRPRVSWPALRWPGRLSAVGRARGLSGSLESLVGARTCWAVRGSVGDLGGGRPRVVPGPSHDELISLIVIGVGLLDLWRRSLARRAEP